MTNTYFLAPSLPPLVLGERPEISFEDLMGSLRLNLSKEDLESVEVLLRSIDLANIRSLYLKKPFSPYGNLTEKELDEALLIEDLLPAYVFDFLNQFQENKEKARHFFGLLSLYYQEEISKRKGFLKELLIFQRELRLVLSALRAKKTGRDMTSELQFEDFSDFLVADILAQKDAKEYDPPIEYQEIKEKLKACGEDPWEQYRTLVAYQFERIEEMTGYPLFSVDWILGYVARFLLVQKWNELDEEKGKEIFEKYKRG